MNSNFEWQKHQTNERVQARYQEAEIHRSLKSADGASSSIVVKIVRLPLVGLGGLAHWFSQRATRRPYTSDERDGAIVSDK